MRLLVAALATTGALAQWSDPDSTKKMAQQALERRHSLAQHFQKGNEKKHRTLTDKKKHRAVLTDEEKEGIQRMLKGRARESVATSEAKTEGTRGTNTSGAKKEGRGGADKKDEMEPVAGNDSANNVYPSVNWGKDLMMTAAYDAKSQKSDKSGPTKAPSNSGGKRPGSSPSTPSDPSPSGRTDKSGKSGGSKSRKISSGICTKRLHIAFEEIVELGPNGPFGRIETPSDVTKLCAFVPPTDDSDDYNFGCPFLFIPGMGFLQGEEEYIELLGEAAGTAFNSLVLYCQCHQGFDLGCAAKIPHGPPTSTTEYVEKEVLVNGYSEFIPFSTPADRADYCMMVGVWNGDFESDVAHDLSPDVMDCGCFFTGTAKDMVGTCPGVELGAFFEFPVDPDMPTSSPTIEKPTYTFYDSFENGEFPGGNWTVSNGDLESRRRRLEEEEESSSDWALTTARAYNGDYSIKNPDLNNDAFTPRIANAILAVSEDWGTPGILTFSALADLDDDYLLLIVDGELYYNDIYGDVWDTYDVYLGPGSHEVIWVYWYNRLGEDDPGVGEAFVDEVFFTPSTLIPTYSPTVDTPFPSYFPTVSPTVSPTSNDDDATSNDDGATPS